MNEFVHLHLHSHYSLLDGAIKIDDIINKAIEFGMPSVAITDHGNMFGAIEFYEKAVKKKIKPIIGCEMYVSKSDMKLKNASEKYYYHLILLAKDDEGYRNLSKLAYLIKSDTIKKYPAKLDFLITSISISSLAAYASGFFA